MPLCFWNAIYPLLNHPTTLTGQFLFHFNCQLLQVFSRLTLALQSQIVYSANNIMRKGLVVYVISPADCRQLEGKIVYFSYS